MYRTESAWKDKSLTATGIVIAVIIALLVLVYIQIYSDLKRMSLSRVEEGATPPSRKSTPSWDGLLLNAAANIISSTVNPDIESILAIMKTINPMLDTMNVGLLLRDGRTLSYDGTITESVRNGGFSFAEESAQGEHIFGRTYDPVTGNPILRHFVPVAMLYGITDLETLHATLNIDNIYNYSSAFIYIIDTRTVDFLVDTVEDGTVAVVKVKNSAPGLLPPYSHGYPDAENERLRCHLRHPGLDDPELASIPIVAMTANLLTRTAAKPWKAA